ncbi:hypothetical protein CCAX7_54240 [Capsulimonas corticalis]|uniref:Uncharacterized protein n=1 Tax=Capsulimonas corticalis TaxID=2219043 RepID=A0A402CND3_9BACT|nr:hypothetical protein [Capsulimonas corticalis]BDI33373.1 hypothetical protein CCAX7_54240 [Capsulimonas corticalis]
MATKVAAPTGTAFFTNRIGLWAHLTSRMLGNLHDVQAMGFDDILVKVDDGRSPYHVADAQRILKDAKTINLPVAAWCYVYPDNIADQVKSIAASIPAGVTELVVDAEAEWERFAAAHGEPACIAAVHQLMSRIAAATGHRVNLHLSSFWSPQLHPEFPFRAFMIHCATFQPQAYLEPGGTRSAASILSGALSEGASVVRARPGQALVPTINNTQMLATLKARQIKSFSVYVFDPEGDAAVVDHETEWKNALTAFRAA